LAVLRPSPPLGGFPADLAGGVLDAGVFFFTVVSLIIAEVEAAETPDLRPEAVFAGNVFFWEAGLFILSVRDDASFLLPTGFFTAIFDLRSQ